MRPLFISEQRYIRNLRWHWTKTELKDFDPVALEYYAPPPHPSDIRFNNDYTLQFVSSDQLKRQCKSYGATILPNTVGADVFLTVDKDTLRPLMTELLAGEAFSIKYYKEYVEKIEERLARLSQRVCLRKCAYCRIFVVESDICFLAFPNELVPVVRGAQRVLCSDDDAFIACASDGNEVVYFDGWIQTTVTRSDRKLVATYEGNKEGASGASGSDFQEHRGQTFNINFGKIQRGRESLILRHRPPNQSTPMSTLRACIAERAPDN